ncbi:MAG: DUF2510 domain-containing protein [Trebonia sp.]
MAARHRRRCSGRPGVCYSQRAPCLSRPGASNQSRTDAISPPGWHPDPYGQARLRWWDGTQWTGHTSP